jgi:hypothetical protein
MSLNMDIHLSVAAVTEVEMGLGYDLCSIMVRFPTPTCRIEYRQKRTENHEETKKI